MRQAQEASAVAVTVVFSNKFLTFMQGKAECDKCVVVHPLFCRMDTRDAGLISI